MGGESRKNNYVRNKKEKAKEELHAREKGREQTWKQNARANVNTKMKGRGRE